MEYLPSQELSTLSLTLLYLCKSFGEEGRQLDVKDGKAKELVTQELVCSLVSTDASVNANCILQLKAGKMSELIQRNVLTLLGRSFRSISKVVLPA